MSLDTTNSLTSLDEIKAWIGGVPQVNALWVYSDGSGATAATVEVTATGMILVITGGGDAGTTNLVFADTDTDILSELITKINAASGWKASRLYHSSMDSTDLVVTGAISCLTSANEITLKAENNYLLTELINRASDFLNRYCNRKLASRSYTFEVYDGNGRNQMMLEQYPVTQVSRLGFGRTNAISVKNTTATTTAFIEITSASVILTVDGTATTLARSDSATIVDLITAIDGETGWDATLMNSDFGAYQTVEILQRPSMFAKDPDIAYIEIIDDYITGFHLETGTDEMRSPGILYYVSGFTRGKQNIFVSYTGGYATIPYTLEQACIYLVAYKYGQSKRAGSEDMKSESMGEGADYKYERFSMADLKNGLPADLKGELALFKRVVIG